MLNDAQGCNDEFLQLILESGVEYQRVVRICFLRDFPYRGIQLDDLVQQRRHQWRNSFAGTVCPEEEEVRLGNFLPATILGDVLNDCTLSRTRWSTEPEYAGRLFCPPVDLTDSFCTSTRMAFDFIRPPTSIENCIRCSTLLERFVQR